MNPQLAGLESLDGTHLFTLERSAKALRLNRFLHGLIVPERRALFRDDPEAAFEQAGLTAEDVEWRVDEGPAAATLSVARPFNASGCAYEHRVIAGWGTPEFHVTSRQRSTSKTLATRRFRVVRVWPNTEVGPPMATTGRQQVYRKGGWGGGPAGPQNINIHPAPELRIAVAVFRTKGAVHDRRPETGRSA